MTFQVSPGVNVSEIDNSASIAPQSTSTGAFVGKFRWGPVDEIVQVVSETDLISKFSAPDLLNSVSFHTAASFLRYSNDLRVIRAVDEDAFTANAGGDETLVVKNADDYLDATLSFANHGLFIARYPGALGNSLSVEVFAYTTDDNTTQSAFESWDYAASFNAIPKSSPAALEFGSENDELHIAVIDKDGLITGRSGSVLEIFPFVSQASGAKSDDGSSIYYVDVINERSRWVWFAGHDATAHPEAGSAVTSGTDFSATAALTTVDLDNGADGGQLGTSEYLAAYALFGDADTVDISLLIAPDLPASSETTVANNIIAYVEQRKDCVAFISPGAGMLSASDIVTFADALNSSSYAFVDSGRLKVFDKYNDRYINIPACGAVAGLCAATDRTLGAWFSPAGTDRGQIFGVTRLYFNPNKAERDTLYKASVNPIVTFPGEGTILFGDKTKLGRSSAFDRINVRRLFILLRKTIAPAGRNVIFELNDEFTRAQFVNLVEPFLRTIQGRRGITDFRVICDSRNNTPDVIDRNEFIGDIYIKPARSINFVQLNFVATRTGANFNEITGG